MGPDIAARTTRRTVLRSLGGAILGLGASTHSSATSARPTDTHARILTGGTLFTHAGGVQLVAAESGADFNYPYYLYTPPDIRDGEVPLLVGPNISPFVSDDLAEHQELAAGLVEGGMPRQIADALRVPALVPVFPRPESEPVDWTHYTHQLDRETLQIEDGPLERIDLQLLAMVEHARTQQLGDVDRTFREEIMLTGFSGSGTFSERFTVLHADRVLSVTAGGVNGMALLPLEEAKGHTLPYHIGIADVESLINTSVNLDALDATNQFLYIGAEDENDTLPYDDAWTDDDLRETARDVYGENIHADRFPFSQSAYEQAGIEAQFRMYRGMGHRRTDAKDLIEFHRRTLAGEDVSDFGANVGDGASGFVVTASPTPAFTVDTPAAIVGEPIRFDASDTQRGDTAIVTYDWAFDDGTTDTGDTATHTYSTPGQYTVELTVEDFFGDRVTTTDTVTVTAASTPTATATDAPSPTPNPDTTADAPTDTPTPTPDRATVTPGDSGPGLGVKTAVAALGTSAYVLARRIQSTES